MNRKGILDTVMSWLVFAFYALLLIFATSLCGCATTCKKDIESGIRTDAGGIAELRASEQLSAYLRTEMPSIEELNSLIDALDDKGDKISLSTQLRLGDAKEFLEKHPEAYVSKNYGDFLVSLHHYYRSGEEEDAQNVFDTVTKALFSRKLFPERVRELNDGRLDDFYYTPAIGVKLGMHEGFFYENPGDDNYLFSKDPLAIGPVFTTAVAFKVLPTADREGITVKLELYSEDESKPIP